MRASELAVDFGIADVLRFEDTPAGLVKAVIALEGAAAELFLHGAQVTRWARTGERPVIFTSSRSAFMPGKAIRGGIPIIFPWFGAYAPAIHGAAPAGAAALPQHGFARTALWHLASVRRPSPDELIMILALEADAATAALWPHPCRITCEITVGRRLRVELIIDNRSADPIVFEEALHSYFAVSDIGQVTISGLDNRRFIDKVDGGKRKLQESSALTWAGERDSVYLDAPGTCIIHDPGWQRRIVIAKSGSDATIVWNPWREKGQAMADLGADEWRSMVCVEAGNVADNAIQLPAGHRHRMATVIDVRPDPPSG